MEDEYAMDGEIWIAAEDDYLVTNYRKRTYVEMSLDLKRSPLAIKDRAQKLGIQVPRRTAKKQRPLEEIWAAQTERAKKYIGLRSGGLTSMEIAEVCNTTKGAVIGTINRYLKRVSS